MLTLVSIGTTCPALEQLNGGLYQPSSCTEDVMEYESQCRVLCGVGYVTSGPTLLTCLATGSWSVEPGSVTCIGKDFHSILKPNLNQRCTEGISRWKSLSSWLLVYRNRL